MWKPSGPLMQPKPSTSTRQAQRNAFWNAMPSRHHEPTCHGLPRPGREAARRTSSRARTGTSLTAWKRYAAIGRPMPLQDVVLAAGPYQLAEALPPRFDRSGGRSSAPRVHALTAACARHSAEHATLWKGGARDRRLRTHQRGPRVDGVHEIARTCGRELRMPAMRRLRHELAGRGEEMPGAPDEALRLLRGLARRQLEARGGESRASS